MKKVKLKLTILLATFFFAQNISFGQNSSKTQNSTKTKKWFIGYEILEMSMNKFQFFACTFGYRINPNSQLRIVAMDVKRTEEHEANSWQSIGVDGPNVNGRFRTIEINFDRFLGKSKNWYYGLHAGYKNDQFKYLLGPQEIDNHTILAGPQFGYQKMNLFKVKHLFINFSMPFHYYFHSIPAQQWGETKIREFKFTNNIWFFIGYCF